MPQIMIDHAGAFRRQQEKVAKLEARLFKLRREIEEEKKYLARLYERLPKTSEQGR